MVNNNKVLTVSYGTFSCTLEGFEDSFDTMKAIAEYFRDLASDDRYFGAEPPQPDADMLARIAQREITRKVEAHHDESGIVLRASENVPSEAVPVASALVAAVAAPEPVIAGTAVDSEPVEEAVEIVDAPADEPVVTEDVVDEHTSASAVIEDADEDVAADPVVESGLDAAEEALEVAAEDAVVAEEEPAVEEIVEDVEDSAEEFDIATKVDAAVEDAVSDAEVEVETVVDAEIIEAPVKVEPVSDVQPSVDSIAAKLQRIRAVVARNETLADDEEFTEDLQTEAFVASAAADISDVLDVEDQGHDDDEEDGDAISAILGQLDIAADMSEGEGDDEAEVAKVEVVEAEVVEVEVDEAEVVETEVDEAEAVETEVDEAEVVETEVAEAELAEAEVVEAEVDEAEVAEAEVIEAEVIEDTSLFAGLEMDPEADPVAVVDQDETEVANILDAVSEPEASVEEPKPARKIRRVRVKAIKRADLEQAIASGAIETVAAPVTAPAPETPEAAPEDSAQRKSSLTAEAEADLMRELAEVEAEFSAPTDPAETVTESDLDLDLDDEADDDIDFDIFEDGDIDSDDVFEDDDDDHSASNLLAETDQDEDLTRLMAAAEEKLDDPEITSKAEAFQNLRAAVAATQADRETGGEPDAATKDNEYRADLAQVVKPRRPSASSTASPRPRTEVSKPAPLKLVAAQRVDDLADAKPASPVRPRRIATPLETAEGTENDNEFSAFIEEMDVHSLAELLEATASYMSFAEGREQFSRPQLMSKVRLVHDDDFNREDGLRAFGQLLREGKIEKAGGGRFTASGDIGYKPQARAAG